MIFRDVLNRVNRRTWARALFASGLILTLSLSVLIVPGMAHEKTAGLILKDANGNTVGVAFMVQKEDQHVTVKIWVKDMAPGFHGTHLHESGVCAPPDFMSAGGHYNPTGEHHPQHAGDFPSLLVNQDGRGYLSFRTDRFLVRDLLDGDGTALIVHSNPDNFSNIPERYGGPDQMTLMNGDSGLRVACGKLERLDWHDLQNVSAEIQDLQKEFQIDPRDLQDIQ